LNSHDVSITTTCDLDASCDSDTKTQSEVGRSTFVCACRRLMKTAPFTWEKTRLGSAEVLVALPRGGLSVAEQQPRLVPMHIGVMSVKGQN
jgi:hypothetical protein